MSSIHSKLSPEALQWRDLSPKEQRGELSTKITAFVMRILFLGATFSITYFGITSGFIPPSQMPEVLPYLVGGGLAFSTISFYFAHSYNAEGEIFLFKVELSRRELAADLKNDTFTTFYDRFKNKKLGPLVRQGFLTTEQGDQARELFKDYEDFQRILSRYNGRSPHFITEVQNSPETYPDYHHAQSILQTIEPRWKALQQSFLDL